MWKDSSPQLDKRREGMPEVSTDIVCVSVEMLADVSSRGNADSMFHNVKHRGLGSILAVGQRRYGEPYGYGL